MNRICLIAGSAPLYRKATFKMLESVFNCDFILGEGPTKQMDISMLENVEKVQESKFLINGLYTYKNLIKLSKEHDIIILNIASNNILYYLFPLIARFRGQKIVSWTHGWYGKEGFVRRLIKRIYFNSFDKVLVYGNYAKNLMIKNGIKEAKIHVIHNSLDYYTQLELRKQMTETSVYKDHFGNNYPVLLFIGRLRKVKKLDQIIEAMAILKERGEYYNLMLIGGGEDEMLLKEITSKYQMESNVWFYGPCFDETSNAELVYNADLCVAPGNVGLTAMHTLMFGCPVLTHNNFPWQMPEFESIKEYKTGLFFDYDNIDSLADKISEWFKVNGTLRDHVRNKCYKEIDEQWNPEYQTKILEQALNFQRR